MFSIYWQAQHNVDLEAPSNPLEYFELFCTPDIAEVIARKRNQYAQTF
jgi:hypothetical protein